MVGPNPAWKSLAVPPAGGAGRALLPEWTLLAGGGVVAVIRTHRPEVAAGGAMRSGLGRGPMSGLMADAVMAAAAAIAAAVAAVAEAAAVVAARAGAALALRTSAAAMAEAALAAALALGAMRDRCAGAGAVGMLAHHRHRLADHAFDVAQEGALLAVAEEKAMPRAPARPVRPMRWT